MCDAGTSHAFGQDAALAVARARSQVAALIDAPAADVDDLLQQLRVALG